MAIRVIGIISFIGEAPTLISPDRIRPGFSHQFVAACGGVELFSAEKNEKRIFGIKIAEHVNPGEFCGEMARTLQAYRDLALHLERIMWALYGRALVVQELFLCFDGKVWARAVAVDRCPSASYLIVKGHSNGNIFQSNGWNVDWSNASAAEYWVDSALAHRFDVTKASAVIPATKVNYLLLPGSIFSVDQSGPGDAFQQRSETG